MAKKQNEQNRKKQANKITGELTGFMEDLKEGFKGVSEECQRKEDRITLLEGKVSALEKALDRQAGFIQSLLNDGK